MPASRDAFSRGNTLGWLLRLRWTAVAGQTVTILLAAWVLHIPLPLQPLLVILLILALSNGLLHEFPANRARRESANLFGAVLALDTLLLTAMLYWTGGAHNPFTSFYLVHIALAAMLLQTGRLWALVGLSVGCFLFLFYYYHPLNCVAHGGSGEHGDHGGMPFDLHLRGMGVAYLVTSACIAYFVARMKEALRHQEEELAQARVASARHEQFASLATLSAGVAHELGSPLGSIAVIARELERELEAAPPGGEALADARLIRAEVERCRAILDRLNARSTRGVGNAAERFDAAALEERLRAALGPVAARLEVAAPPGCTFYLPLEPLTQALGVLVQNAADADSGVLRLELAVEEGRARFTVCDHGPGLSPAASARAGEPFFTTKAPGRGMGLGLFLVRTLASRLGGELALQPNPGGGTRATLLLPLPAEEGEL